MCDGIMEGCVTIFFMYQFKNLLDFHVFSLGDTHFVPSLCEAWPLSNLFPTKEVGKFDIIKLALCRDIYNDTMPFKPFCLNKFCCNVEWVFCLSHICICCSSACNSQTYHHSVIDLKKGVADLIFTGNGLVHMRHGYFGLQGGETISCGYRTFLDTWGMFRFRSFVSHPALLNS